MPVKNAIDDHIQRLFDGLLNSLRRGITKDMGTIEEFLNTATETLSQRPQSVEEIGDANSKHSEFAKKKMDVSEVLKYGWIEGWQKFSTRVTGECVFLRELKDHII